MWLELILALLDGIVGAITAFGTDIERRARSRRGWLDFARQNDLLFVRGRITGSRRVMGDRGPYHVVLDTTFNATGTRFTRLRVDTRGAIPDDLSLRKEDGYANVKKMLGGQDVETGDLTFDNFVLVHGSRSAALALLSKENRRRVERALRTNITLAAGSLLWETPGWVADATWLGNRLRELTELADALVLDARTVPRRLLENVLHDDVERVRSESLAALLANHPGREETTLAARAALRDGSLGLRVTAAKGLGEEGFESLVAVSGDAAADGALRARALETIAEGFESARAAPLVLPAIESDVRPVRLAAVRGAARLRLAPAIEPLERLARSGGHDDELGRAIASALGEIGEASGESAALVLLGSRNAGVRLEAARALATIGGRDAVHPLLSLAREGLPFGELRAAATAAVRAIQERLGPKERGGLAIAEILAADGALSAPEAAGGALSVEVPRDPDAERS